MPSLSHRDQCVATYLQPDDKLLFEIVEIKHDGYDEMGPESNLYDLHLFIKRDGNYYEQLFHREYWYHGKDDEPYVPVEFYSNPTNDIMRAFHNEISEENLYSVLNNHRNTKKRKIMKYSTDGKF